MRKKRIKFKALYLILFIIILTACFLILKPSYLFDNNEFIKADYYRHLAVDHFKFLPDNPDFDVVYLAAYNKSKQKYGLNVYHYNLGT